MTVGHEPPRQRRSSDADREAIGYLRSPRAIRERTANIFDAGLRGELAHFRIDLDCLGAVAERVVQTTRQSYPDLAIPYHSRWNHFDAGDVDRLAVLDEQLAGLDAIERGRALYDLVITSVLLDAGAGNAWTDREPHTNQVFSRSEGLAVASFHMFVAGGFSSIADRPLQADAARLQQITAQSIAQHFQVSDENPLVGLDGRALLLQHLGRAVAEKGAIFRQPRLGSLFDYLKSQTRSDSQTLPAGSILAAVLDGLGSIWPGRTAIAGVNLGDVWPHPAAGGSGPGAGLVPLHKLSQWLTYSLIEPLEAAGVAVVDVDELTGLAEYRNGGLFVDMGVLVPRSSQITQRAHEPGSEIIVEWRALTVALLDRVAERVRTMLGKNADQLPLAKVLEGGTWSAGRAVARERRPEAGPPIRIASDGTVF